MKKEKLLVIVGPTAVGKSKVAITLAKSINGEIISADSMQVYKNMDIGTAKPSLGDRAEIKHHLIDIVDLKEDFSVAEYQRMARKVITQIHGKGKLPILVGGSGLYIRAVVDKLEFPSGMMKSPIRRELEKRAESEGLEGLYRELQNSDPRAAKKIHPHDARRIIRALEVIKLTGKPFSEYHKEWEKRESIYDVKIIGL
ncbi:MAG: tRNA (adenosine(37)-N6)-dimethylallyltransferase MiaA, partial [Actinomycetota bacterium]